MAVRCPGTLWLAREDAVLLGVFSMREMHRETT
jgi:hypothetical protein